MSANTKASEKPLVCVVDDDSLMRDSTVRLIRSFGFRVEAFASAEEFGNSGYLEETACLILDVRMPGMSGLELQRRLAAKNHRIPIIFITSYDSDDVRTPSLPSWRCGISVQTVQPAIIVSCRLGNGALSLSDYPFLHFFPSKRHSRLEAIGLSIL